MEPGNARGKEPMETAWPRGWVPILHPNPIARLFHAAAKGSSTETREGSQHLPQRCIRSYKGGDSNDFCRATADRHQLA